MTPAIVITPAAKVVVGDTAEEDAIVWALVPAAQDYAYHGESETSASWAEVNMTPSARNARPVRPS
jgi:hypothetical protein